MEKKNKAEMSLMSMAKMMDKVGVNLIESYGVITAVDNRNSKWFMEADLLNKKQVNAMREKLLEMHEKRYVPPKKTYNEENYLDRLQLGRIETQNRSIDSIMLLASRGY